MTMTTKATPAPWTYQPTAGNHDFSVYSEATGRTVALVRDFDEANARLIAAAPEMAAELAALKHDLEAADLDGWSPWKQHLGEIRALLARIDGTA